MVPLACAGAPTTAPADATPPGCFKVRLPPGVRPLPSGKSICHRTVRVLFFPQLNFARNAVRSELALAHLRLTSLAPRAFGFAFSPVGVLCSFTLRRQPLIVSACNSRKQTVLKSLRGQVHPGQEVQVIVPPGYPQVPLPPSCPRKALRTLNQKSFFEDFVNFWR